MVNYMHDLKVLHRRLKEWQDEEKTNAHGLQKQAVAIVKQLTVKIDTLSKGKKR